MRFRISMLLPVVAAILFLGVKLPLVAQSSKPWFFAVLSDPQMGMYANNQNVTQEMANFRFAVANLNRLQPRFVVICGDLVNKPGDTTEVAAYKHVLSELHPSIRVYNVAGNHDVGNVPTPETIRQYRAAFGPDYYSFREGNLIGLVLDSNLIRSPQGDPQAAKEQKQWLQKKLASFEKGSSKQFVVFQHIPYFIKQPGEAVGYFNIPLAAREEYLQLFKNAGVRYIFAGHLHYPDVAFDGPLTEMVTGATGKPLGGSTSGLRIVTVNGSTLSSKWFCFGGIPNTIVPSEPAKSPCMQ